MNIAIIDDHPIYRKGVIEIIKKFGNFDFVIEACNGKDFIEKIPKVEILPDLCIIDIKMPEMDGIQLVEYLKQHYPNLKILVLSTYDEEYYLIKMIKYGVNGYILKDCNPKELMQALHSILSNSYYYNNLLSKRMKNLVDSNFIKIPNVTENEKALLQICGEDLSYYQIAEKLNKSQRSIEGYRDSLFRKFDVNNRASLVLLAVKLGLIKI